MVLNRLASCGSDLTMSPPSNTTSSDVQRFCTVSHCSMTSDTVESLTTHSCTLSRKGCE